ncbi:aldo/keto reductase [Cellulophaga omnivescoria]|uniref:aldo/keto reductase n=1 Tax=Cellulophaga omnivescoria TaxID=1888890 RepID=UPI000987158C|nr:aldo/keto reductase [Cellulophaga omnivescoria]
MINFNEISKIGIGTYRMTYESQEHINALQYAIESGVNLIDTASNYQFGNSEKLIGDLLKRTKRDKTFIITKAGYINGNDINRFSRILNSLRTIKVNNNFLYSIEPSFLEAQITASLKRLNTDYIDGFLIHNPEHYFDVENHNQKHIYEHLIESCTFLETLVDKGVIRYYGISSNILPTRGIDLKKIINDDNDFPNFKLTQFPYNLVENEANEKNGDESLIDFCKKKAIKTFANRPLNTTYNGKVLRLADYSDEFINVNFETEEVLFNEFLFLIKKQLDKFGETSNPEDFVPIKFFINNRKNIANPEAVNKALNSHLLPFIEQLQFTEERIKKILNELLNYWILYSKKSITDRSLEMKNTLINKGVLIKNDKRDLSLLACESYLKDDINHVLVGMRNKKYVDNLLSLV